MVSYVSTRGQTAPQSFADVLLTGLAPDGGLFLPQTWPQIAPDEITRLGRGAYGDYPGLAVEILARLAGASFTRDELGADVRAAYAGFDDPRIAPLIAIAPELYLLDLSLGPTLAFKDLALQVLGRLFTRELKRRGRRATVVVATSGDTGSAAIAALGGLAAITLFVLYPNGRVSEVQRRQMTTSLPDNVHTIALDGTFDDAQSMVKALFADTAFAADVQLTAVNSINFARIAAQIVYYFAAAQIGGTPSFVVPTGNFGNVFAGEAAMRMGLPARRLVVATNANDILVRALAAGIYEPAAGQATLSPSMDIQAASNFERALFEASGRDSAWLASAMTTFARERRLVIPPAVLEALRERYAAYSVGDAQTLETISWVHSEFGRLIDPHTAVAMAAARPLWQKGDENVVVLSTAHPAKFPGAVTRATGITPPLPDRLARLYEAQERMDVLANDLQTVRQYIADRVQGAA